MVDLHTHILPGIDDGSPDPQTSLFMLQEEYRQGIDTVVLTPHFYAHQYSPEQFLSKREHSLRALLSAATEPQALPDIILGAEVLYYEGISYSEQLSSLCINGTQFLMLEMPYRPWTIRMLEEVASIPEKRDIIPIIAHLDRYPIRENFIHELFAMNVLIQLNNESILGWKTAGWCMRQIENGYINFLGSDCHNLKSRAPNWTKTLEKLDRALGLNTLEILTESAGQLLSSAIPVEWQERPAVIQ